MNTRAINMQKRRDRILSEARRFIVETGFDSLNTRDLAKSAGVTAPTLYNLIGNKEQILVELCLEAVKRIEARLTQFENSPPLEMAEAIVVQSIDLFSQDERFYKAAMIAADHMSAASANIHTVDWINTRSSEMAAKACRAARTEGLLRGNISAKDLGEQMYVCYRVPFRDWGLGLINLDEFSRIALRGFYMCLASDAADTFRQELIKKLRLLNKTSLKNAG